MYSCPFTKKPSFLATFQGIATPSFWKLKIALWEWQPHFWESEFQRNGCSTKNFWPVPAPAGKGRNLLAADNYDNCTYLAN